MIKQRVGLVVRKLSKMLYFPASERNKEPLLNVLRKFIHEEDKKSFKFLELASGSGQHVSYFSSHFPSGIFQPSDIEADHITSIQAFIDEKNLTNVLRPTMIDLRTPPECWPVGEMVRNLDYAIAANVCHIASWDVTLGLFSGVGYHLKSSGLFFLYGPMKMHGRISPESNVRFDASLRGRDPSWGLRDVDDLEKLAQNESMKLVEIVDMPANNKTIVFRNFDQS